MDLSAWFSYTDRDRYPYNPLAGSEVTTSGFWIRTVAGAISEPKWINEEWMIRSALVPLDQVDLALDKLNPDDLKSHLGWHQDEFLFGERQLISEVDAEPWLFEWEDPETHDSIIQLRQDFVLYHKLRETERGFIHLIDQAVVATVSLEEHSHYDPFPRVIVSRDYLRDYLAARQRALIVSVVADRWAHAPTPDDLSIVERKFELIDEHTRITSYVQEIQDDYARGRSSLYRNLALLPHDQPRFRRSAWHYFGSKTDDGSAPSFIVDADGKRGTLNEEPGTAYLFFRPEVLTRYLTLPGYSVRFHMRTWGMAHGPGEIQSIDVGINHEGLVQAFAADIADQRHDDQMHWASYSCVPRGGVCREMFDTRMQLRPPHSPSVIELIREGRAALEAAMPCNSATTLFEPINDFDREIQRMNVGPLTPDFSDFFLLSKYLYKLSVEALSIAELRSALSPNSWEKEWKQIRLLEQLLLKHGKPTQEARSTLDPLRALDDARVVDAHLTDRDVQSILRKTGHAFDTTTPRTAWNAMVDSVTLTLRSVASFIQTKPGESNAG